MPVPVNDGSHPESWADPQSSLPAVQTSTIRTTPTKNLSKSDKSPRSPDEQDAPPEHEASPPSEEGFSSQDGEPSSPALRSAHAETGFLGSVLSIVLNLVSLLTQKDKEQTLDPCLRTQ